MTNALFSSAKIHGLALLAALLAGCVDDSGSPEVIGDDHAQASDESAPVNAMAADIDAVEKGESSFKTFALQPLEPVSVAAAGTSTYVGGTTTSGLTADDMEVRRYTFRAGAPWSKQWGGAGDDRLLAMDGNASGFAIAGETAGPVYFGPPVDADDANLDGTVVVAFDSNGDQEWGVALTPVIPSATFTPVDLALAPDGSVAVLGTFTGPMDFGGIIGAGCFGVAYYNPDGVVQWVHSSSATDCILLRPGRIAFDDSGALWYAGTHRFSLSLGGCSVGGSPYHQPHVFQFAAGGGCQWANQWPIQGDILHAYLHDLAVSNGSVVITGSLPGAPAFIDFGGGPLNGPGTYLVRLDDTGSHAFSARHTTPMRVAASDDGEVLVATRFVGTVDLGGGPVTSAGAGDLLVAGFSAAGAYLDGERLLPGPADQDVFDTDADGKGRLRVIGQSSDAPESFFLAVPNHRQWSLSETP